MSQLSWLFICIESLQLFRFFYQMRTRACVLVHAYSCVRIRACVLAHAYSCVRTRACVLVHAYSCMRAYSCVRTRACVLVHACVVVVVIVTLYIVALSTIATIACRRYSTNSLFSSAPALTVTKGIFNRK